VTLARHSWQPPGVKTGRAYRRNGGRSRSCEEVRGFKVGGVDRQGSGLIDCRSRGTRLVVVRGELIKLVDQGEVNSCQWIFIIAFDAFVSRLSSRCCDGTSRS
jgi:hypothetical protein